ncbi:hypothetical protein BS78_03G014300 [Paspalum vaginatum]|nr:hypothetical protein BS78_03G014300 [Paspalum vaginatum]
MHGTVMPARIGGNHRIRQDRLDRRPGHGAMPSIYGAAAAAALSSERVSPAAPRLLRSRSRSRRPAGDHRATPPPRARSISVTAHHAWLASDIPASAAARIDRRRRRLARPGTAGRRIRIFIWDPAGWWSAGPCALTYKLCDTDGPHRPLPLPMVMDGTLFHSIPSFIITYHPDGVVEFRGSLPSKLQSTQEPRGRW